MAVSKHLLLITLFIVSYATGIISSAAREKEYPSLQETKIQSDQTSSSSQLLKRLEANEKLVHHLLGRVGHLESREKSQQREIMTLQRQLNFQKRRTTSLETVLSRILVNSFHFQKINEDTQRDDNETLGANAQNSSPSRIASEQTTHRIRRAETENLVAFFATLSNNVQHAGVHQIYVFDHVITNLGNAYNNHNGNFVAPVSGTYVFSVTLLSLTNVRIHAEFHKNGQVVSRLYVRGASDYDTSSQTLILQLQKGDDVCVHNIDLDSSLGGSHYSSFSGFLLQEDTSGSVIVGK